MEYDKGFKIQQVELFLMTSMKKVTTSLAVFQTGNGLVIRKNDIPAVTDESDKGKVLVGGLQERTDSNDEELYELPYFQDNLKSGEAAFTVMMKSDLTREHVLTLFDKL